MAFRRARRALLAFAVVALLWLLAGLAYSVSSFWMVLWMLLLWAGAVGR